MPCVFLQLMDVAVKLPPFKPPKVAVVEYEAPQLLPLPDLLDEEVHRSCLWQLSQLVYLQIAMPNDKLHLRVQSLHVQKRMHC